MKTLKILSSVLFMGAVVTALWIAAEPSKTAYVAPEPATPVAAVTPVETTPSPTLQTVPPSTKTTPSPPVTNPPATPSTPVPTPTPAPAPSPYTRSAVATHNSRSDCWSVLSGKIYNLTNWIDRHPGGSQYILAICGSDGTQAFTAQHGGQSTPQSMLAQFFVANVAS